MAKQKSPAYQWYPKDILADQDVVAMSFEEEGVYRHLLDVAWLEDGLPNDPDAIFLLAKKCKTRAVFDRIWARISKKFRVGRGQKLRNRRQESERDKQRKRSKERKLAADHRWEEERKKRDANASALAHANGMQNGCFALSSAFACADQVQRPKEPRVDAPRSPSQLRMELRTMVEMRRHLRAACHRLIESDRQYQDADPHQRANLSDELKTIAARDLRVADYDGREIEKIIDAVIGQRSRRSA